MKKILKIILGLLMFVAASKVKAFTINYSQWSEEYPEGVHEKFIESEERYKWYKEQRVNEKYLKKNEGTQKYIDEEDTIVSEPVVYLEMPENLEEKVMNVEFEKVTLTPNDITHINLQRSLINGQLYISEIEIWDTKKNKMINYEIELLNYKNDYSFIKNGNTNDFNIYYDEDLYLNLKEKYNINNIEVVIHYKHESSNTNALTIGFMNSKYICLETKKLNLKNCQESCFLSYNTTNSKEEYVKDIMKIYVSDILYKKYDIEKVYTENYEKEVTGYIKDEKDKKVFYRYITDEKVVVDINQNLIIDKEYCVKNFCMMVETKKTLEPKEEITPEETITKEEITPEETITKEEIKNPKTLDTINNIIMQMTISSIILIGFIILVVIKIYNKRKKTSTFVETL